MIGLSTCGWQSWSILAVFIIICAITNFYNVKTILSELALKEKFGCLHESEKYLTRRNLPFLLGLAFISAFIGQIFGLGGGFIYGPMLLMLGVNPIVVSSTCLYLIIFSGGASMFMFLVFGKLNWTYTLWLALFTGLGVILGLFVIKRVMKQYKRPSLVAFALALAIIISIGFSIFGSVRSLKVQVANDIDIMQGDPIC
uniref:Uncharacterized protein n=1 Tax=Favella ehrenbergii TaxID=182087 RepID=A0A7S3I4N7_9SPIT|mmetsp:Transcript_32910/g.40697  ORF Transcript_32910/g.40697 Transcript_32910/m.40697 type:complete len:199 (+) Transcript_32910:889-1485(+)